MTRKPAHGLLWKDCIRERWDKHNSRLGPSHPYFLQKDIKKYLWIDGWSNPRWSINHLRQTGEAHDDATALLAVLKACAKNKDLCRGTQVHDVILRRGLLKRCSDALVTMYAQCGALVKAKQLIDMYDSRDAYAWTALLAGYCQKGQNQDALDCFEQMQRQGLSANVVTYSCVLKACGNIRAGYAGERIHDEIAKLGLLQSNLVLGNALVNMYAKCGDLAKARRVVEDLPVRDVISWTTLIMAYAEVGDGEQALDCFDRMQCEGLSPNSVTFICILKACGSIRAIIRGQKIHDDIMKQGLLKSDIVIGTALVDMYAKCGALLKAREVLEGLPVRNATSWNAMIAGYANRADGEQVLECFAWMQSEGISPNAVTYLCILKACGSIGAAEKGAKFHDEITKQGFLKNNLALGNALVNMYAKCGTLAKARQVLEELPVRDVISWNALIVGYTEQEEGEQALSCLEQMHREGLFPDAVTYTCIFKACGSTKALDKGERLHDEVAKKGLLGNDVALGNALVDMYTKCGALAKARQVLKELRLRNLITWNALISGYAEHGRLEQALKCFEQMKQDGLSADGATFSCVLSACGRVGLLKDAEIYYTTMTKSYCIKAGLDHHTCMVDLFARAGHLDKAVGVIERLSSFDCAVWSALLGACQKWEDVDVGRWAFEHAMQADKGDPGIYIVMTSIYMTVGMLSDAQRIEAMRVENKAWKRSMHS